MMPIAGSSSITLRATLVLAILCTQLDVAGGSKKEIKLWSAYCLAVRDQKDCDRRRTAAKIQEELAGTTVADRVLWHEMHFQQTQSVVAFAIHMIVAGGYSADSRSNYKTDVFARHWALATAVARGTTFPTVREVERFCRLDVPTERAPVTSPKLMVIPEFYKRFVEIADAKGKTLAPEEAVDIVTQHQRDVARIMLAEVENDRLGARVIALAGVFDWVSELRAVAVSVIPPEGGKLNKLPIVPPSLAETAVIYAALADAAKRAEVDLEGTGAAKEARKLHARIRAKLRVLAK